jgi:branched-subunit amino acid aminotransferase/4-amino-4-deoxychorismate lyase
VGEIPDLDEAAISSSSRGLVPVVKIEDQVVGDGRPGPITGQILDAYRVFLSKEIRTAVPS